MQKIICSSFDLSSSIESGQIFRYEKKDEWYFLCIRNTLIQLRQEGNVLYWDAQRLDSAPVQESLILHLLRLDEDYEGIIDTIKTDKFIQKAITQYYGLRVLRQDPWECLISFLASMASNIRKHSTSLSRLAQQYGKMISLNGYSTYTFPGPDIFPPEKELRALGFGFRARYMHTASTLLTDVILQQMRELPYYDAKIALMKYPGIANKVANCILLFSFDHLESFPVDVWMKRVMEELYFHEKISERKIEPFAQDYFGQYAGYAQQFLFHWRRLQ